MSCRFLPRIAMVHMSLRDGSVPFRSGVDSQKSGVRSCFLTSFFPAGPSYSDISSNLLCSEQVCCGTRHRTVLRTAAGMSLEAQ